MTTLKINTGNTEALAKTLNDAQGRATVKTLTAENVQLIAEQAQSRLDAVLPKAYQQGAKFEFCFAGPSASSYRNKQGVTRIILERGTKDWFLVKVERDQVYPKTPGKNDLILKADQQVKAAALLMAQFVEIGEVPAEIRFQNEQSEAA